MWSTRFAISANLSRKGKELKFRFFSAGGKSPIRSWAGRCSRAWMTQIQDIAKVDIEPRLEGRNMAMLLTPK